MNRKLTLAPLLLLILAASGCGGSAPEAQTPASDTGGHEGDVMKQEMADDAMEKDAEAAETPPTTVDEQIALGQQLYGANCASCHGDAGQGVSAPPVVGKNALPLTAPETAKFRKGEFKTAGDVAKFVVSSMPPGKAGSLSADEYLAILAFDLHANGVELEHMVTLEGAEAIVLHP